jgi:hypothetical protein
MKVKPISNNIYIYYNKLKAISNKNEKHKILKWSYNIIIYRQITNYKHTQTELKIESNNKKQAANIQFQL